MLPGKDGRRQVESPIGPIFDSPSFACHIEMKPTKPDMKSFPMIMLLLALAGCATQPLRTGEMPRAIVIRSVTGVVQYRYGEDWHHLYPNTFLTNGAQIRTSPDGQMDVSLGTYPRTLAVFRVTSDSELAFVELGDPDKSDPRKTSTVLDLRKGEILGSVKNLSQKATLEILAGDVALFSKGGDFSMEFGGPVADTMGKMTLQSSGMTFQLHKGQFFDPKKDEIRKSPPPILVTPLYMTFTNILIQPECPSPSQFGRGLEAALRPGF